jgi:4-hydroxy-tetrahydrodipicolinate reductase
MDKEIISISHKALDRSIFANGALTGAKWLINKPAGMYSMLDIYSS